MIPNEVINDILKHSDIVKIISNYIPVTKKGSSYVAICPFHQDKNPSLQISSSKQIYKCFACGEGGNAFSFVEKYEHIPFLDAVKKVASLSGYNSEYLKEEKSVPRKNNKSYSALKDIASFYHYMLKVNNQEEARKYLESRQIDENMQDYFNLGYAPGDTNLTLKCMRGKGYDLTLLDHIGITTRENGSVLDRFHERILFPIYDEFSNVIGFSGRIISGEGAKYVNSPTSDIFNKSEALYNYQNAKNASVREKCVYVVEGFMDVFALYRLGILSSVALMGTAFTPQHCQMLRKLNCEVRIMLDGDRAGRQGVIKMIPLLEKQGVNFRIVDYGTYLEDPDELWIKYGKDTLTKISQTLIDPETYLLNYYQKEIDISSTKGIKEFVSLLSPRLNNLKTRLEKESFLKRLSEVLHVSVKSIIEYVPKNYLTITDDNVSIDISKYDKLTALEKHEQTLIHYMLTQKDFLEEFKKEDRDSFGEDIYGLLINYIIDLYSEDKDLNIDSLILKIQGNDDEKSKQFINLLSAISIKNFEDYDIGVALELKDSIQSKIEKKKNLASKKEKIRQDLIRKEKENGKKSD